MLLYYQFQLCQLHNTPQPVYLLLYFAEFSKERFKQAHGIDNKIDING